MTLSSGDRQGWSEAESSRNGAPIDSQHFSQQHSQQCSQTSPRNGLSVRRSRREGSAPPAAHSNTHRPRSRPCEWRGSAGASRAVFGLPYRPADQIAGRHETSASHSRASREVRYRSGQHQQDRAWLDIPEREDAPSPRRQPRRGVTDGLQGQGPSPALRPVSSTKAGRSNEKPSQLTTLREDGANRKCRNARMSAPGVVASWHPVHQVWRQDAPCRDADASRQRRSSTCSEVDPAAHPFLVLQTASRAG